MRCFYENIILKNILGFGRMHKNKIFFVSFFLREINLKVLRFFFKFFKNIWEKTRYFNTEFISYNVKIQSNIKQNW